MFFTRTRRLQRHILEGLEPTFALARDQGVAPERFWSNPHALGFVAGQIIAHVGYLGGPDLPETSRRAICRGVVRAEARRLGAAALGRIARLQASRDPGISDGLAHSLAHARLRFDLPDSGRAAAHMIERGGGRAGRAGERLTKEDTLALLRAEGWDWPITELAAAS